jgi:hypothetical protein
MKLTDQEMRRDAEWQWASLFSRVEANAANCRSIDPKFSCKFVIFPIQYLRQQFHDVSMQSHVVKMQRFYIEWERCLANQKKQRLVRLGL